MKTNAFHRLICTIACGVVAFAASDVLAQSNSDVNDGGTTPSTVQSTDEAANDVDDASAASDAEIYYPPGMEIPLTETEIPGSAYFTGPNGERIDASTFMNQFSAGQEMEIPSTESIEGLSPSETFSVEGVYDGTLTFPMGTFPTTPFGERIVSEVPSDESQSGEIPGALVDKNGNKIDVAADDGETPGTENGVPVDEVVRPDDSSAASQVEKAGEVSATDAQKADRSKRIKRRLQDAISEQQRLTGLLKVANQKNEALTQELKQFKATRAKQKEASRSQVARLTKSLKKAKAESQKSVDEIAAKLNAAVASKAETAEIAQNLKKMERELQQVQSRHKAKVEEMQATKEEAEKKVEILIAKAKEDASQAEAKINAAEAQVASAQAKVAELSQKMASNSQAAKVSAVAGIAAVSAAETDEADEVARKAREAKAAAELEVSRKLKELEERKKLADAAEDAGGDNKDQGVKVEAKEGDEVLSLDDQIKRLKATRDQQIAESETRIRAKQQREIDKLLEEGKAVESDEVKAAVEKMKSAIKTSEEKLRSRFLRRLKRLKEDMKKSLK